MSLFRNELRLDVHANMKSELVAKIFDSYGHKPVKIDIVNDRGKLDCVITFANGGLAKWAIARLNGLIVSKNVYPNNFKLCLSRGRKHVYPEHIIQIHDLADNVDDNSLYLFFSSRYKSIFYAKVIKKSRGISNNIGIIKLSHKGEYKNCLVEMDTKMGPEGKCLKLEPVMDKKNLMNIPHDRLPSEYESVIYSDLYDLDRYLFWNRHKLGDETQYPPPIVDTVNHSFLTKPDHKLVDFRNQIDELTQNVACTERDINLFNSLDSTKWFPLTEVDMICDLE